MLVVYKTGVNVRLRRQDITTDEDERYSFTVNVIPDDDSFPPNVYYGMHSCQNAVSNNGKVLKNSPAKLSMVLSDVKIDWLYVNILSKPK